MKRSEMLKLMSEVYGKKNNIFFDKEDAERILKVMESLGMRPPCNSTFQGHSLEDHLPSGQCNDYIEGCNFEWDKE